MNMIDRAILAESGKASESLGFSPAILFARDPEVFQLVGMAAADVDQCFLMTDEEWEHYDKTVVNRACELGLVKIYSPGGGWGHLTGWKLTRRGRGAIGLRTKRGMLSRVRAFFFA
ncbi:hypothetical protein ACC862_24060 [Rhizobium ruizarguesonis]